MYHKTVQIKSTLEQAMKAQRGVQVYLYVFFNLGARCRWLVNDTPGPLYPRERDLVPIVQEVCWAPGLV
jgi:hypothetical protein